MVELRTAMIMTGSLSAPVAIVGLAPMILPQHLATDTPDIELAQIEAKHERLQFSQLGIAGLRLFQEKCSGCHGTHGVGSSRGPALIDKSYFRASFSKQAFHYAVKHGVRQQKWSFGDMPAFPNLKFNQIERLERYLREVQKPLDFR